MEHGLFCGYFMENKLNIYKECVTKQIRFEYETRDALSGKEPLHEGSLMKLRSKEL